MRVFSTLVALGALAACSSLPDALERPIPPAPDFHFGAVPETELFEDGLWDDGNAEIARFSAHQMRYGEMREGELILITVKEAFDAERLVKADGPHHEHVVDAIKLNTLLTFQTGVYTYRQMASAFLTRDHLAPMKLAASSQEWCGTTSAFLTVRGDEALLRSFSYFGAEGEQSTTLDMNDSLVLEDALPVWLRALDFERAAPRHPIQLVPSQLSNRAVSPEPVPAEITVGEPESIEVPEGTFEARPVTVAFGDRRDVYHLETAPPHAVVRFTRGESHYERTLLGRAPYWEMHGTEHDALLLPEPPPAPDAPAPDAPGPAADGAAPDAPALSPESPAPE